MKQMPISNKPDVYAIVDNDDYEYLSKFKWSLTKSGYVVRSKRRKEPNAKNLAMHRIVTECPEGLVVDHINFNKLDNRKENLRIVTVRENSSHQPPDKKTAIVSKPKIEKLYQYNRLLTKSEIKTVDKFIESLKSS